MNFDRNTTVEDILNLSKKEIQTFLQKSNAKISGSKLEVATRACQVNKLNHGFSEGQNNITLLEPPSPEDAKVPPVTELASGWSSNLKHVPNIAHKDVESYLLHSSHRTNDKQTMKCYRQYIRGLSFYREGYIHNIMTNNISDTCQHIYVRSKCFPSMKKGTYAQWILLQLTSPVKVVRAECTCPAGLGEGCTHVAALLFALEAYCKDNSDLPCTSKPCQWNKPTKRKHSNDPVDEMTFKKFKYRAVETPPKAVKKNNIKIDHHSFFQTLSGKLAGNESKAVLLHLVESGREQFSVQSDINVGQFEEICSSEYVKSVTDEYIYLKTEGHETSSEFYSFVSNIANETISDIELLTRGQSENPKWIACRKCRITATCFHDIVNLRDTTTSDHLANKIIGSEAYDVNSVAVSWEKKYEPIAKKKFVAFNKLKYGKSVKVQDVGIFLCPSHGHIGASPDGIVVSEGSKDLLEIKCPYKWRNCTLKEACESKDFYCTYVNNKCILKKTHRYFTQIQGQMLVTNMSLCYLVIFTLKDLVIIPVEYDADFCDTLLEKLDNFYKTSILSILFNSKLTTITH